MNRKSTCSLLLGVVSFLALSACNAPADNSGRVAEDVVTGTPEPEPAPGQDGTPNPDPTTPPVGSVPALGISCHSDDASKICLSLKYVVYKDGKGAAIVSDALALSNLAVINQRWAQCGIAFEIGEFERIEPAAYGLSYNTPTMGELTEIRNEFEDDRTLLLVNTGNWSGSLGSGSANAYSEFPSGNPRGVVMEAEVADYPNIIAHELGHSLGLSHVSASSNIMSPLIYTSSTQLTSSQCTTARNSVANYYKQMKR